MKNNDINLCSDNDCTGCMACLNSCGRKAIEFTENAEGFYRPTINKDICVGCRLCMQSCPIITPPIKTPNDSPKIFAAYSKNKNVVYTSSSGGIFYELSSYILDNNGVIYGAYYDSINHTVSHIGVENLNDLKKIQGSKYVQSVIGDIFNQCKKNLQEKRLVLFSGTPCQIAGLYSFLKKEYSNLYTIDIVCHGVPSKKFYHKYLEKCRIELNKFEFFFRNYKIWDFDTFIRTSKTRHFLFGPKDFFMKSFLHGEVFNECCYKCRFAKIPRIGDISLGDFWGIKETSRFRINRGGTSLILINNNKGQFLFDKLHNIECEERSYDEAVERNHNVYESSIRPLFRNEIYTDMFDDNMSLKQMCEKYDHRPTLRNYLGFLKRRFREIMTK